MTNSSDDDGDLRRRTRELLLAAEAVSLELAVQTAQLNSAIDQFNREILHPLREALHVGETDHGKV